MSTTRRRYSDNDRATALAALDACGGNASEAARVTGVPRKTLEEWDAGRVAEGMAELRQVKKAALSDRLEAIAHEMLDAAPDKIGDATLKDTMVAVAVAIDKAQLLKGQPTAITQTNADPADARRELAEYLFTRRVRDDASEHPGRGPAARQGDDRGGVPAVH